MPSKKITQLPQISLNQVTPSDVFPIVDVDVDITKKITIDQIKTYTLSGLTDVFVTGGTYNGNVGEITFTNNTGGTFNVTGLTSGTSINYSEVTYSQLYDSYTSSTLVVGAYYLIHDFETCYDQPDFNQDGTEIIGDNYRIGALEPILVLATAVNNLSPTAYSFMYPQDKITYDITFTQTERTLNPAKGRITERIDERGNRTDYDFRNIQFKRYGLYKSDTYLVGTLNINSIGDVLGSGTLFQSYFSVGDILGVYVGPYNNPSGCFKYFEITNIVSDTEMTVTGKTMIDYVNRPYSRGELYGVPISPFQTNIISNTAFTEYYTFNSNNSYNTYIGNFANLFDTEENSFILSNNVFLNGKYLSIKLGDNCYNNSFDDDMDSSSFGYGCWNNIITNDFDRNVINNYFKQNIIVCDFRDNEIGNNFHYNMLGDNDGYGFNRNRIGEFFEGNFTTFANGGFENNFINEYFAENLIDGGFYSNNISNIFHNNRFLNFSFEENTIFNGFNGNLIYQEFKRNRIGSFCNNNQWSGGTFTDNTVDGNIYNNIFFGSQFENNTICYDFYSNNIYSNFDNNFIYSQFNGNTLSNYANQGNYVFDNNYVGSGFKGNQILNDFVNNEIGPDFVANYILFEFRSNKVGKNFFINEITGSTLNNTIGDYFQSNIIRGTFSNNIIGENFYNNDVKDGFGFGAGAYQGNTIGNNFYNNTIGEYFYNNQIPDNFYNNLIGNYFQWNTVRTYINGVDFAAFYGNITNFTYLATGNTASDNIWTLLGGTTNGDGINATFNVEVSGGTVVGVTGATQGKLYQNGDTITISGTLIGGTSPEDDVIITVTGLSPTPSVYQGYTCQIFSNANFTPRLSFYDNSDVLTITDINV